MLQAACAQFATSEEFYDSDCDCEGVDPDLVEEALDLASDTMTYETNGLFRGRCEEVLEPCLTQCDWLCHCGCGRRGGIEIPGVHPAVDEVVLDGVTLDITDYEYVEGFPHNKLYRITDPYHWPSNTNRGNGPPMTITITHGHYVNQWARDAAVELACFLINSSPPTARKSLDPRVRSTTIDGTRLDLTDEMRMTLPAVVRFLAYYQDRQGIVVHSPELAAKWRV